MKSVKPLPLAMRAAFWWNRNGNSGRGAIPRALGRWIRDDGYFLRTRNGALLSIDPPNLDVYASIYNGGGAWDSYVMDACLKVLRPGDTYYDIGANTGLFSIDATCSVERITVYAFEPQPSLAEHVRTSFKANGVTSGHCLELLLGNEEGERLLYMTSHSIHASLVPREVKYRTIRLPIRKIDTLVTSGEIQAPDVIKIDVEGAELEVFKGASQTLERHAPSIIFEGDENLGRMSVDINDVAEYLKTRTHYAFRFINPDGTLEPPENFERPGNYLAISPRHRDRVA